MTLKNHQNHYNIKFLKGYGHSISVKNSKIILKSNHDPFSKPDIESWYANSMPYEKIVLSGKGHISTEALSLLSENNRNVLLLDTHGKPITYLNPARDSLTAAKLITDRLYHSFSILRNNRLRSSILQNKIKDIEKIKPETRD